MNNLKLTITGSITIVLISAALMMNGCVEQAENKTDTTSESAVPEQELSEVDSKRALLVESIIRTSPSLAQTSEVFGDLNTGFNRGYLNDLENVSQYSTLRSQGINLGVYLADLGYITTYEQSQEVIFYMKSAQKLAEAIGVSDVFDESTVERMEMNISDKDSIISLISELYWKTDAFLKELNRENISALIICGGWVEGMHIGYSIMQDNPEGTVIYRKILEQQSNLKKIMNLLNTFGEEDEFITFFKKRLGEINSAFQAIRKPGEEAYSAEEKVAINSVMSMIETLRNEINQP